MRRYFLILAALIFLAQLVQAQAPVRSAPPVGGFWYGFGLGAGPVRLSCDICQAETHAGDAGSVPQWTARKDNDLGVLQGGPVIGHQREYAGPGTHAPN